METTTYTKIYDCTDNYWKPLIEPASPEEIKRAEKRLKDSEKDPSSFIPWSKVKKRQTESRKPAPGKITE